MFRPYRRKQIAELRPFVPGEVLDGRVSVSQVDQENGSPRPGDMIARNPKNHEDQWLVTAAYFTDNFEPVPARPGDGERPFSEVEVPEAHKRAAAEFREHFREVPLNECEKLADPDYGLDGDLPSLTSDAMAAGDGERPVPVRRQRPCSEQVAAIAAERDRLREALARAQFHHFPVGPPTDPLVCAASGDDEALLRRLVMAVDGDRHEGGDWDGAEDAAMELLAALRAARVRLGFKLADEEAERRTSELLAEYGYSDHGERLPG